MISHGDARTGIVKKAVLTSSTATRRPALGNLVNRTEKARVLHDKKPTNPNGSNENIGVIDLKNVKARVDTHWKNEPLRKPLSRSNSTVKKASLTSINSIGSTNSGPKLVKTKSIETATLKEVKIVEKAAVKRQDSTLTRRVKIATATSKASNIDIKRTVTRTKSSDSTEVKASKVIADVPAIQSRFRPPTSSSYSNGLIDGVSEFCRFFFEK